jgi:acyl-[acyl-carrier-protein] desaturase
MASFLTGAPPCCGDSSVELGSMPSVPLGRQAEVIKEMEAFVEQQLPLLKTVDASWQPSDIIPDLAKDDWQQIIQKARTQAKAIPDAVLVVLVGDMITEEALPTYQTLLNRLNGVADATGADENPWARWSRGWTAEENRHGDLLNRYLYVSGRVDMRAVETTVQHLISNGFDPHTGADPYRGLVYTSFQERATKVSHHNVSLLAQKGGDPLLARICATVAGDEARHEEAYKRFIGKVMDLDPNGAIITFADMMRLTIAMPGERMADGGKEGLYERFAAVAQQIGVYTAYDYADIITHLLDFWQVSGRTHLSIEAERAQEYVCGLPAHYRKLADRMRARLDRRAAAAFGWIFGRSV